MQEYAKKKLVKKLIKIVIPIVPFLIATVIIVTGLGSVVSFFTNLFQGTKDKYGIEIDVNAMSLEDLIEVTKDNDIFTEDVLDEMMIERQTLTILLEEIQKFNTSWVTANKQIQYKREYVETVIVTDAYGEPIYDNDGNVQTIDESKIEYRWRDYSVSTKETEYAYKIDWQVVYCAAVFQKIEQFKEDSTLGTGIERKRLSLNQNEIDNLISDFKPRFYYVFDIVRDSNKQYTYSECSNLPNDGLKSNGGSPNTQSGRITWYEPISLLDTIELTYLDKVFINDGNKVIEVIDYLNMNHWTLTITKYWPNYDQEWFGQLLRELPGGDNLYNTFMFRYGAELENYKTISGNWVHSAANGVYKPLAEVESSINIPVSAGGMSIPLFTQYDKRWGGIAPVGGGTLASSGCGLVSLSMVLSYLENKTIYPSDIYAWCGNRYYAEGIGQSWSLITDAGKQWGYNVKAQAVDDEQIVAELSKGRPVIVSTSGYGTSQYFTGAGHYIVLRGLTDDGKVLVNDPNDNTYSKTYYSKAYDPEFIENECRINGNLKMMWSFYK